ncbi:MAG TPA: protein phosphatase 2C domain-containing protein, partial [Myxococcaceae bacterium]|nr:protein phosphatase 2C domain-containing protein [Myxococcaceae bacterium]
MPLTTEASGLSDVGKKRQQNEDAMLIEPALGLYIVADGMGGHAAGEVASAWAIEIAKEHIRSHQKVLADLAEDPTPARRAAASALVESA